ncbi:hypothetical protein Tco_0488336 [Tanacetum coccineum]
MNDMMNPRRRGIATVGEEKAKSQKIRSLRVTIHLLMNNRIDQGEIKGKIVPENKRVSLIATKLCGKASAWWQQLKLTRERVGKPRVTSFEKQNRRVRVSSSGAITGGSSGSCNVASCFVPNQT